VLSVDVEAIVRGNYFYINEVGIEIISSNSQVMHNQIEKSHENGIKVISREEDKLNCEPLIWNNIIYSCGQNGILC